MREGVGSRPRKLSSHATLYFNRGSKEGRKEGKKEGENKKTLRKIKNFSLKMLVLGRYTCFF